jgi:hypothetical protein
MLKKIIIILLNFSAGIAGNLIAGWVQQSVWSNVFTLPRIAGTIVGVLIMLILIAILEQNGLFAKQVNVQGINTMNRKNTLESNLRDCVNLINQYESKNLYSDDPKEQRRSQKEIERLWDVTRLHWKEYASICQSTNTPIAPDLIYLTERLK